MVSTPQMTTGRFRGLRSRRWRVFAYANKANPRGRACFCTEKISIDVTRSSSERGPCSSGEERQILSAHLTCRPLIISLSATDQLSIHSCLGSHSTAWPFKVFPERWKDYRFPVIMDMSNFKKHSYSFSRCPETNIPPQIQHAGSHQCTSSRTCLSQTCLSQIPGRFICAQSRAQS